MEERPADVCSAKSSGAGANCKLEGRKMWIGIAALLVVCWVVAFFVMHISSFLIHIILLVAVISLVYHFIRGRSGA